MPHSIFQQSLHGYRDGHRLIASSFALPKDAARDVQVLSDLSGHSFRPEFDGYLTGYPLPEIRKYALARTWYAREVRRPGSVWTHTLFIDYSDLGQIHDLSSLVAVFRYPVEPLASSYVQPVVLDLAEPRVKQRSLDLPAEVVGAVVQLLYGDSSLPVFVPASNSTDYESLVLNIWSQQWPRLRRSFSFCTGALAERQLRGRSLDLQIMPLAPGTRRLTAKFTALARGAEPLALIDWLRPVIDDLMAHRSGLREFLWRVGADISSSRGAVRTLVETFADCRSDYLTPMGAVRLIRSVAHSFPEPADASSLKSVLLSTGFRSQSWSSHEYINIVVALCLLEKIDPYRDQIGSVLEHLVRISTTEPIAEDLVRSVTGDYRSEFFWRAFSAVSNGVSVASASFFVKQDPMLFLRLLAERPSLLESVVIWRAFASAPRSIVWTAVASNASGAVPALVIRAALDAGVPGAADVLSDSYGAAIVNYVLDWTAARVCGSSLYLPEEWSSLLHVYRDTVVLWTARHPSSALGIVELLVDVISLGDLAACDEFDASAWANAYSRMQTATADWRRHLSTSVTLSLGLFASGDAALSLLSAAFGRAHRALADCTMDAAAWQMLEDVVPPARIGEEWDRCDRLRRGLIEKAKREGWSLTDVKALAPDEYVQLRIADTWQSDVFEISPPTDVPSGEVPRSTGRRTRKRR